VEHTAEWTIRLYLFEHDTGSTAHAVLETGVTTLRGQGRAERPADGSAMTEIGTEQAAGRALIDLGHQLTGLATKDATV
jgi:hypothetical protein